MATDKDNADVKNFSYQTRLDNIAKLKNEKFDILIIGGGINGAGAARDAALRGMKVALVEARDFAIGASSRSSKLIHGGIRYLENLEFSLVFESLNERQKLFAMAPHLVHPLRFLLPLYKRGRVGMFKMGLGMWLYDALSMFEAPELHERLSSQESLQRVSFLQQEDLLGAYEYSDAYMDDDRLAIETLRSANENSAVIANYMQAVGYNSVTKKVKVKDKILNDEFEIQSQHILSTVGPWTDIFRTQILMQNKKILRPTKGVHLTFSKKRFPLPSAVVMAAEERIIFAIPRHEMVIVGTTDTDFNEDPEKVSATNEDIKYLLSVIKRYFPGLNIEKSDVVATYAGVRPLVSDGATKEGKTSREHFIFTDESGITFITGGKYTTYRLIARQAIDHCLNYFSLEERYRFQYRSSEGPINSFVTADSFSELDRIMTELRQLKNLSEYEQNCLAERHGDEALQIMQQYGKDLTYSELEALHAIHSTMCMNLLDFYSRRVPFILSKKDHGASELHKIAKIFQMHFQQSETEVQKTFSDFQTYIQQEFANLGQ